MELLKGRPVAERIDGSIREILGGKEARLVVYLIGADPSSVIYARSKIRKGEKLGVDVILREFDGGDYEPDIITALQKDAADENVNGIMIERPLPDGLEMDVLMEHVPKGKDVEGLHPANLGALYLGNPNLIPPTPLGALFMLLHYEISTEGKRIAVVGRSPNVGRPLATLLSMKRGYGNGTVTLAHSRTADLSAITSISDIILTAVGRKGLVNDSMVKDGAVMIDLGINPDEKGSIVGDVDIGSLEGRNVKASPTPGGTGPVTVSSMFLNVAVAQHRRTGRPLPSTIDPIIRKIYQ